MSIAKEFKEFISRGNVIDLAVGVIIGGAFGKIVTSLVDQVIMPPIGLVTGGIDFSDLKIVLKAAGADPKLNPEVAIQYGAFINVLIQFLIVAFVSSVRFADESNAGHFFDRLPHLFDFLSWLIPKDWTDVWRALRASMRSVLEETTLADVASGGLPKHVAKFAELSGDYNPLHFDEAFAAGTRFGRLVVQGGLTTGLLHALVAMDMPGPGTVFLSQNWKFTAPVYIDDTITAAAEVLSVHATKPVTQLAVRVTRQTGDVVLEGEAWCYTFAPDPSP